MADPANRLSSGRFAPGVSGNPSGRPSGYAEFRALCREHSDKAVATLAARLESEDDHAAISAAKTLLEHGWGKPRQSIDVEGSLTVPTVSLEEAGLTREQIVELARKKLEGK